jgi:branched-chain amino acid transport system permease protein
MSAPAFQVRFTDWRSAISLAVFAGLIVALAVAPLWAGRDDLRLLGEIFAYVALASLWNLLAGYAGLVSVGQQAFVGLGGYTLFALAILAGVSPLWAIPASGLIAAVVAVPVAALVFRLRGHYFAIGTWVVAEVFRLLASQVSALGGGSGTSLPAGIVIAIAPSRTMREFVIYWIALALAVCIIGLMLLLLRSRYGLALTAIRDNELAARSNGVDVARVKLVVYVFAAFGTAMVGALVFLQKLRISPDAAFSVNDWTAFVIFITVIGGIGRIEGPIIGTLVFFALRQTLADLGSLYLLMLGAVAIAVMLKAPKGIWGLMVEKLDWQIFPLERRVIFTLPPFGGEGRPPERSEGGRGGGTALARSLWPPPTPNPSPPRAPRAGEGNK